MITKVENIFLALYNAPQILTTHPFLFFILFNFLKCVFLGTWYDHDEWKTGSNAALNSDQIDTFVLIGQCWLILHYMVAL